MTNAALLATRYARRPLLIEPAAARELSLRIRALDDRVFARPGRLSALLRKVGLAGPDRPSAMEDDDWSPPPPIEQRLAYAPLWAGEVEDQGYCWSLVQGVALMCADTPLVERGEEFCGVVYHGYDTLKAGIQDAMADSRVQAVFLRMASPGGVVAGGLPELARFMRTARATGNAAGKPIWVYADMACSAAYWIAAQADRVLAPSVGLVGSIGAVLIHENWAGALAKDGVEITPIQFGAQKTAGAWWEALSPAARADLQAEIDQCGRDFVADVALGRPKLTAEALIASEARVFLGQHDDPTRSGLDLGFVDEISSEEAAFSALVALISPQSAAPAARTLSSTAAATSRPPPQASRESPMAPTPLAAAEIAKIDARLAKLTAQRARLEAATAAPGDDEDGDEGEDGEDSADDEDGDEAGPKSPSAAPDPAPNCAAEIAASPEAKVNPALALSAIASGLTLTQFQAMASSTPAPKPRGALAAAMAESRRMAPDAPQAASGSALFQIALADAKAKAEAHKGR